MIVFFLLLHAIAMWLSQDSYRSWLSIGILISQHCYCAILMEIHIPSSQCHYQ